MAEESSVYKICPQCGQSVSVAAKFCPTCGTPFTTESSDFVAYERFQNQGGAPNGANMDDTMSYSTVNAPQDGGVAPNVNLYPGPDQGGSDDARRQPRPVSQMDGDNGDYDSGSDIGDDGWEQPEEERDAVPEFSRGRGTQAEAASNPGVRRNPLNDDNNGPRKGLIVTIVAAVLLVAVIAAGVVMAFKLGIVGSDKKDNDPMTLAQQEVDQKNYEEAISQLEKIVADGNATQETYELLGEAYNGNEEPEKAADAYLRGYQALNESTLKKSAMDAYLKLGDESKAESDYVKAKEYYDTVLEKLDPSNSAAIAGLASLQQGAQASASPSPTAVVKIGRAHV